NTTISPFLSSVNSIGLTAIKLPSGIVLSIESPLTLRIIISLGPAHLPITESGIVIFSESVTPSILEGNPADTVVGKYLYLLEDSFDSTTSSSLRYSTETLSNFAIFTTRSIEAFSKSLSINDLNVV